MKKDKSKALGLSLAAVLAVGAMWAQGASAEDFSAAAGLTTITGNGTNQTFTVTGRDVTCNLATLDGEVIGVDARTFTEVTVTPEYTECTAFGFPVKITGFGHLESETGEPTCDFVLRANGTADLVCEKGGEVTIASAPCAVHIPPQSGLSGVSYTNNFGAGTVNVTLNINNITVDHTDGFLCPFEGSAEGKNGSMSGTAEAKGKNSAGESVYIAWLSTN